MARPAIHPGEILADELEALGVTPTELARHRIPADPAQWPGGIMAIDPSLTQT